MPERLPPLPRTTGLLPLPLVPGHPYSPAWGKRASCSQAPQERVLKERNTQSCSESKNTHHDGVPSTEALYS